MDVMLTGRQVKALYRVATDANNYVKAGDNDSDKFMFLKGGKLYVITPRFAVRVSMLDRYASTDVNGGRQTHEVSVFEHFDDGKWCLNGFKDVKVGDRVHLFKDFSYAINNGDMVQTAAYGLTEASEHLIASADRLLDEAERVEFSRAPMLASSIEEACKLVDAFKITVPMDVEFLPVANSGGHVIMRGFADQDNVKASAYLKWSNVCVEFVKVV